MAQSIVGTVVKTHGDTTIIVKVETRKPHPIYKKLYTESKLFKVHDEQNKAVVGDRVQASPGRKISKQKYFHLSEVLSSKKDAA